MVLLIKPRKIGGLITLFGNSWTNVNWLTVLWSVRCFSLWFPVYAKYACTCSADHILVSNSLS